jgi:oligopeptide transport system substrate-binding protein
MFGKGFYRDSVAQNIKDQWEQNLGIQCYLESHETWSLAFGKITQGDFQVAGILWRSLMNDPIYTLNYFRYAADPSNFAKWEHPKYQEMLNLADEEVDSIKRLAYLKEAEAFLMQELPVLPIFYSHYTTLVKEHVEIDYANPTGILNPRWASLKKI